MKSIDYDHLWRNNKIINHEVWPTWDLMKDLFSNGGTFLEIGAGNRPRIPVKGSYFVDTSVEAVENLNRVGAKANLANSSELPFEDNTFDIVCAFEILEHVGDDKKAFKEIFRVLKGNGKFLFSVPLHMRYWSPWDELAGHYRRYEPKELQEFLEGMGFEVEGYISNRSVTVFQRYRWLGKLGVAVYSRFPRPFIFLEQHLIVPVVKLETKIGAFSGLTWERSPFSKIKEGKTGAILLCSHQR